MTYVYDSRGIDPGLMPSQKAQEWTQTFRKRYGYYPADLTMWAWDAPFMVAHVMEKAGTVTDREKIRNALEKQTLLDSFITPYVDLGGGRIFDQNRQAFSLAVVTKWKDKTWIGEKYYSVVGGKITEVQAKSE